LDCFPEPLVEVCLCPETEAFEGTVRIQGAPGLAVGLGRVPDDPPGITSVAGDGRQQILDADFVAGAEVDRITVVVALARQQDSLGRVFDVEKLARGRTISPGDNFGFTVRFRLKALANERWNDVRGLQVEAVAGAI